MECFFVPKEKDLGKTGSKMWNNTLKRCTSGTGDKHQMIGPDGDKLYWMPKHAVGYSSGYDDDSNDIYIII